MSEPIDISKNTSEVYRITAAEYKGHRFVDLRVWYRKDGELRPTGKGVAIKPEALDAIVEALRAAASDLRDDSRAAA